MLSTVPGASLLQLHHSVPASTAFVELIESPAALHNKNGEKKKGQYLGSAQLEEV